MRATAPISVPTAKVLRHGAEQALVIEAAGLGTHLCDTAKGPDAGDSQASKGEARGLAEGQR